MPRSGLAGELGRRTKKNENKEKKSLKQCTRQLEPESCALRRFRIDGFADLGVKVVFELSPFASRFLAFLSKIVFPAVSLRRFSRFPCLFPAFSCLFLSFR